MSLLKVFSVIFAGSLALAACNPASQQSNDPTSATPIPEQGAVIDQEVDSGIAAGSEIDEVDSDTDSGSYADYSQATLAAANQAGETVLFFHANWCPTCRAADSELVNQSDEIPAGVTILKVDYDTESELKDQYGVTSQHTFVHIDADGNEISKWNGGGLPDVIDNI